MPLDDTKLLTILVEPSKFRNNYGQEWEPTTANIQTALNASVGGWLRFPYKKLFETAVPIHIPNNLTLYANSSVIKASPQSNLNIVPGLLQNTDTANGANIHIYDLTIDGNCLEQSPPWALYNNDPVACRANHAQPGGPYLNYLWTPDCATAGFQEGDTACLNGKRFIVQNITPLPEVYLAWVLVGVDPRCTSNTLPGHCINHHPYNGLHSAYFRNLYNSSFTRCKFINAVSSGVYYWNDWLIENGNVVFDYCDFYNAGRWLEGTGTIDSSHYGFNGGVSGLQMLNSISHDNYAGGFAIQKSQYETPPLDPSHFPKNWYFFNCKSWNCLAGFWAELAGPGIFEDCEAYNMYKTEAYGDFAVGFVIGTSAFGIRHIRCIAHHIRCRGFSGNGWYNTSYESCEAYEVDSLGNGGVGGGIIIGGRNNTTNQTIPPSDVKILDCYIHNIHGTGVAPTYGRGITTYIYNPTILRNIINGCPHYGIRMSVDIPENNTGGECANNTVSNYGAKCILNYNIPVTTINIHDNNCY